MNSLKEITQVITRLKLEKIEFIDDEPNPGDQDNISKLYFGIKSNSLTTDQQAAQLIYGSPLLDSRYTTLKNRLRNKLLNTLFFLDIRHPNQSQLAETTYKTYRYTFWSKTLLFIGARNSCIKLSQKALNLAQQSGLTLEIVQLLADLRNFAGEEGNTSLYNQYNDQLKKQTHNLNAELEAREYNDRLRMMFAKTIAERPELVGMAKEFVDRLDSISPAPNSFYFTLFYFRVKNYSKQIEQDYQKSIEVCNAAITHLNTNPLFVSNVRIGEFAVTKLYCHMMLKEFEEGKEEAVHCGKLFAPTTNTWYTYMDYYFLLAMHTEHFEDAQKIYDDVISNPRFSFQLDQTKERWLLYEAYLQFALSITGKETGKDNNKKFDIKRFLREVPNYKKDKRGYNVSILILQIIMLLEQNNFDSIIDRMDALRTYRQRYLGSSENKQSALFFKMLMVMEKSFFTYEETKTKAQKYYDKMIELGANADETQEGLQILPFEWLWNRILDMLKEKERLGIIR